MKPPTPDLPILRHLTYDELHAALLGLVGIPVAGAYLILGRSFLFDMALTVGSLAVLAVVLFRIPGRTKTAQLLGRETWYFAVIYVLSAILTWAALTGAIP